MRTRPPSASHYQAIKVPNCRTAAAGPDNGVVLSTGPMIQISGATKARGVRFCGAPLPRDWGPNDARFCSTAQPVSSPRL